MKKYLLTLLLTLSAFGQHNKPLPGTPIDWLSPSSKGLIGCWTNSEKAGTLGRLNDYSGNRNHGSLKADCTSVAGKFGPALQFDGTGDYVETNVASFDFERTDSFSCSMWVLPDLGDTDGEILVSNMQDVNPYRGWGFENNYTAAGKVTVFINNTWFSNTLITVTDAATKINDGSWHHYVFTYDGSSDVSGVVIYEDGVSLAHTASENTLAATIISAKPFSIGARGGGSTGNNEWYFGAMDLVLVYNRVLTPSDVLGLLHYPFQMFAGQ